MISLETDLDRRKAWVKRGSIALSALVVYETVGYWWNHSVRAFTLLAEIPSPSGRYKAVLFTQDCGVPCDLENDVSILGANDLADGDAGRVFRSFDDHGLAATLSPKGTYPKWTTVKWLDDGRLSISYDRRATVEETIHKTVVGPPFFGKEIRVAFHRR